VRREARALLDEGVAQVDYCVSANYVVYYRRSFAGRSLTFRIQF
jgi:hypothetical protein